MADERRVDERVRCPLEVRWSGLSGQHTARVYDLSLGGCYIETTGHVSAGERLVIQIMTPEQGWLILHGNIMYSQPGMGFGLHFLPLAPHTRHRLEAVLAHAQRK